MSEVVSIVGIKDSSNTRHLLDLETGQLVEVYEQDACKIVSLKDGDKLKVLSSQQLDVIKKNYRDKALNDEMTEWNDELGGFVFVLYKYSNELMSKHKELIPEDVTKLFYLATFVSYDGVLMWENAPMDKKVMREKLGMCKDRFLDFLNKMSNLGIVIVEDVIKINKSYFTKGEIVKEIKKNLDYTRIYVKSIRYLYENVPQRRHGQLGNYFKLIPYIHRQKNVLCHNPNASISEVTPMHVRELQELLGCHRNSVRSFIRDMLSVRLDGNEAILGFFRTEYDEGKSYVIINPKVFYGGNFNLEDGKNSIIKWFSV